MVQAAVATDIIHGAERARLFVPRPIYDPGDSRVYHRTHAHHARLERDVDGNRGESIGLKVRCGRSDCEDFGVRGRIAKSDWPVISRSDELSVGHRDCTD